MSTLNLLRGQTLIIRRMTRRRRQTWLLKRCSMRQAPQATFVLTHHLQDGDLLMPGQFFRMINHLRTDSQVALPGYLKKDFERLFRSHPSSGPADAKLVEGRNGSPVTPGPAAGEGEQAVPETPPRSLPRRQGPAAAHGPPSPAAHISAVGRAPQEGDAGGSLNRLSSGSLGTMWQAGEVAAADVAPWSPGSPAPDCSPDQRGSIRVVLDFMDTATEERGPPELAEPAAAAVVAAAAGAAAEDQQPALVGQLPATATPPEETPHSDRHLHSVVADASRPKDSLCAGNASVSPDGPVAPAELELHRPCQGRTLVRGLQDVSSASPPGRRQLARPVFRSRVARMQLPPVAHSWQEADEPTGPSSSGASAAAAGLVWGLFFHSARIRCSRPGMRLGTAVLWACRRGWHCRGGQRCWGVWGQGTPGDPPRAPPAQPAPVPPPTPPPALLPHLICGAWVVAARQPAWH